MANKYYIYFLITVVYFNPSETYFLNDNLGTNLPDQYSDPIDENWQEKRSIDKDYSSSYNTFDDAANIKKDFTDYDYKNGNAETEDEREEAKKEKLEKRESKIRSNLDQSYSETDIKQILSGLSNTDEEALDRLMSDESSTINVEKRQFLKRNFDKNYNLNKRCGSKLQCNGFSCGGYDQNPLKDEAHMIEEFDQQLPDKVKANRKLKFKRSKDFRPSSHEDILQAKISLLKDNYKRNSDLEKIEDSAKNRILNNNKVKLRNRNKRSLNSKSAENREMELDDLKNEVKQLLEN